MSCDYREAFSNYVNLNVSDCFEAIDEFIGKNKDCDPSLLTEVKLILTDIGGLGIDDLWIKQSMKDLRKESNLDNH